MVKIAVLFLIAMIALALVARALSGRRCPDCGQPVARCTCRRNR